MVTTRDLFMSDEGTPRIRAGQEIEIVTDWGGYKVIIAKNKPQLGEFLVSAKQLISLEEWKKIQASLTD